MSDRAQSDKSHAIPNPLDVISPYLPEWVEANKLMRRLSLPTWGGGAARSAIPDKYKELILIALQIGTQQGGSQSTGHLPGVAHSRQAVAQAGVTPQEIAELIAITVFICGQPALADYGVACLAAAEEEYAKLDKRD